MHPQIAAFVLAAEEVSDKKDLYPKLSELILGAVAFGLLFFFMWRWAIPRLNKVLEARRSKIQGDLEKAEEAKGEANRLLEDYRKQLSGARDESNRIIEEARRTAEQLRKDMEQKAEREYQAIVGRAQQEIRAERDRVFQELRAQVGVLSVDLASRVVAAELDPDRHLRLVDDYIRDLGGLAPTGNGNGGAATGRPSEEG